MSPQRKEDLRRRVEGAAEAALADHQYVSAIDVLTGMGLLQPAQVQRWRKGQVDFLERVIQGNLEKISTTMSLFRQWAAAKGLKPSQTGYMRHTRGGKLDLQFSASGDPGIERNYRTHYVSPALSERKQQKIADKLSQAAEPVVFAILRDSECSECGAELARGSLLLMESGQPLCLACAGLGDLEYLAAGDAALTRRAAKYSARRAVVVQFSRSRGRYERQGILVETPALEKAEQECLENAGARAAARAAGEARRKEQDRALAARMAAEIRNLFPRCPPEEAAAISSHTAARGSGRMGRTAAGRALEEKALTAAVIAAIRHKHTKYDELLRAGIDRSSAREMVLQRVQEIVEAWRE